MSKRARVRGRKGSGGSPIAGRFVALPAAVLESAAYLGLSAPAVRLLVDLAWQFKGQNNGDLSCAWRTMQPRGWRSRDTLTRALRELLHAGLIEKVRQGGLHQCSLFALTWHRVHDCGGKVTPTLRASELWKGTRENATPNTGAVSARHGRRVTEADSEPPVTRQACR